MALLKQLLIRFLLFYFFNETSVLCLQKRYCTADRRQAPVAQPSGRHQAHCKNGYEMKVCCKCQKTKKQTLYTWKSKSKHSARTEPTPTPAPALGTAQPESRATCKSVAPGLVVWRARRTSTSEKTCLLHRRDAYFYKCCFVGPVEKGNRNLVKHMPWRIATRHCAHSVNWSGTPIKAGLSPAAAHCAELRSFRRGCMAMRLRKGNV